MNLVEFNEIQYGFEIKEVIFFIFISLFVIL